MSTPDSPYLNAKSAIAVRIWVGLYRTLFAISRGPVDLAVRIAIGQSFVIATVMSMTGAGTAVPPMLGLPVQGAAALLLSVGLFTRPAALALLIIVVSLQMAGSGSDGQLYVMAVLGWYAVRGPDALSIDRVIAIGLSAGAFFFAARIGRVADWLRDRVAPLYLFAARLWFALSLAGLIVADDWQPLTPAAVLPPTLAILLALSVLFGLGVRLSVLLAMVGLSGMQAMTGAAGLGLPMVAFLAILVWFNAGAFTIDARVASWLHRHILHDRPVDAVPAEWPHVVIIGAGFGGLACAARLVHLPVRVTIIDRHNYHLFQPLLYQVATGGLSPGDVTVPIRALFKDDRNIVVRLGTVTGIDSAAKQVMVGSRSIAYDMLVVASGATHSYFGRDDWAPFAPGLKKVDDGVAARSKVLAAFERAESEDDPVEQARLLTFVIVGGGPTGVGLAGAIAELARAGLSNYFRTIDPRMARIILVQSGPRVLATLPAKLSEAALLSLEEIGVEVRLNARVTGIDAHGILIGEERIDAATVLWAAGVVASPAATWLDADRDKAGRVIVGPDLTVAGRPDIFVIGDTAASNAWQGQSVPGLAPAAKQAGAYVASVIRTRLEESRPPQPFQYRHLGDLATIGRKSAVADFGSIQLSGVVAWWLWGAIHVAFLVGVRNRLSVLLNWVWRYLSFRLSVQLITGELVENGMEREFTA